MQIMYLNYNGKMVTLQEYNALKALDAEENTKETSPVVEEKSLEPQEKMEVDTDSVEEEKTSVSDEIKAEYKEKFGRLPHHTRDEEKIKEKLSE